MPDSREQSTYLFFTGGGSDKEYHAHLRERSQWGVSQGWVVDYANGKRGHVGQSKPKTPTPLSYEAAKKVFDSLVKSKMKDGYTEAESGVRFTNTDNEQAASGHEQQLCVSLDLSQLDTVLTSSAWGAQQKANGERRTVRIQGDDVRGVNKLGLYVNIPETWGEMRALGDCLIDGEQVGTTFYAFDLLEIGDLNLRNQPLEHRFSVLKEKLESLVLRRPENVIPFVRLLSLVKTTREKQALMARLQAENHEGLVFKLLSGHYTPGRDPNSLKYKFTESSTCCVIAQNQKRSVQIGLLDDEGRMVPVGNVTIPGSGPLPAPGALVEVQYLYFNPGGAFEQPVYLGVRNDILPHEATLTQVTRYKPVAEGLTPALQAEQARILASGTGQEAYFFAQDYPAADYKALEARIIDVGTGGDAFRLAKLRPDLADVPALENRILSVGNEVDAWNFATTIQGSNARALYQHALSCSNSHLSPSVLAEFAALADSQDDNDAQQEDIPAAPAP